jgi:hypothetical protein
VPDYFVFWDEIVGRLRIHRADCGVCKYGGEMHEKLANQGRASPFDWEPADTYAKACEIAASIKRRKASKSQSKPIATFAILSANGEWQRGQVATAGQGSPNCTAAECEDRLIGGWAGLSGAITQDCCTAGTLAPAAR